MRTKNTKGFSLIELMVVISIIGILSVISIVALNVVRDRGRNAAALSAANGVIPAITACVESARDVSTEGMNIPPENVGVPGKQDYICKNTNIEKELWPELTTRYVYGPADDGSQSNNNPDAWYFTLLSVAENNNIKVACDENGCKDCKETPDSGACEKFPNQQW
jgi:prepilin-type N-terminal cleavage/methylation domain-containing protein